MTVYEIIGTVGMIALVIMVALSLKYSVIPYESEK